MISAELAKDVGFHHSRASAGDLSIDPSQIDVLSLPSVRLEDRHNLPSISGIYFLLDADGCVKYVGRSCSIKNRWSGEAHHRFPEASKTPGARIAYFQHSDAGSISEVETVIINHFKPPINRTAQIVATDPTVKIGHFGERQAIPADRVLEIITHGNGTKSELNLLKTINSTENNDFYTHKGVEFLGEYVDRESFKFFFEMCRAGMSLPNFADFLECCRYYLRGKLLSNGTATPPQLIRFATQQNKLRLGRIRSRMSINMSQFYCKSSIPRESIQWLKANGFSRPKVFDFTDEHHFLIFVDCPTPYSDFSKGINSVYKSGRKLKSIICQEEDATAVDLAKEYVANHPSVELKISPKNHDSFVVSRYRSMVEEATVLLRWHPARSDFFFDFDPEITDLDFEVYRHGLKLKRFEVAH